MTSTNQPKEEQQSVKFALAEVLAQPGNESAILASTLLELCKPPSGLNTATDPRVQNGILSAAHFLSHFNHASPLSPQLPPVLDELLGIVLGSLTTLTTVPELSDQTGLTTTKQEATVEIFAQKVIKSLSIISHKSPQWSPLIVSNILALFRSLLEQPTSATSTTTTTTTTITITTPSPSVTPNPSSCTFQFSRAHVIRGALSALSTEKQQDILDFKPEDIKVFVQLIETTILKCNRECILIDSALLALSRVVLIPYCTDEIISHLFSESISVTLQEFSLINATKLALSCVERNANLIDQLLENLNDILEALEEGDPSQDAVETTVFVLKSLTYLQKKKTKLPPLAIDDGLRFVLDSPLAINYELIKKEACSCFCQLLKAENDLKGEESIKPIISKLLSRVSSIHESNHGHDEKDSNSAVLKGLGNEIEILRSICFELRAQKIVDFIVGGLTTSVSYPLCKVDKSIISSLIQIAATSIPPVANDIVFLITNVYKRLVKDAIQNSTGLDSFIDELSGKLSNLAKEIKEQPLKQQLCNRFLLLFQQLGQDTKIKEASQVSEMPTVKAMQSMLSFVSEFMQGNDNETIFSPDETTQQLFRSVWFYAVFLGFATGGHISVDWKTPITQFAHKIPVLCLGKSHQLMKIEMEVDAILKFSFGNQQDKDSTSVKKRLFRHLKACAQQIRGLTSTQCSFLLSVYYLEVLRVRSGEYRALFSYLKDITLSDSRVSNVGYLLTVFRAVADESFLELLNGLNLNKFSESSRTEKLASICEFLLIHYCSNVVAVRNAADVYISQFVGNFPQVLWHPKCLHVLLELLDVIAKGRNIGPLDKTHRQIINTNHFIDLPEEATGVNQLFNSVVGLCNNWMREAIKLAPAETFSVLQRYISRFTEQSSRLSTSHFGVSLAAEILSSSTLSPTPASQTLIQTSNRDLGTASTFVTGLAGKSKFVGEVNGMIQLLETLESSEKELSNHASSEEEAITKVSKMILSKLDSVSKIPGQATLNSYLGAMYQACAFLSRHSNHSSAHDIISRIVWVPVRVFTKESLEVATTAWSWLLATPSSQIAETLMSQIWLAWSWTIDTRIGLFSDSPRKPSPLALGGEGSWRNKQSNNSNMGSQIAWKDDCGPHRVWIEFLSERLIVSENTENSQIDVLLRMLYRACSNAERLSVLPESFGSRFQMLLLALKLAHVLRERRLLNQQQSKSTSVQQHDEVEEYSLVDRIQNAALSWFIQPTSWYEATSRKELESDISALSKLCDFLAPQQQNATTNVNPNLTTPPNSSTSPPLVDKSSSRRGANTTSTASGDGRSVRSTGSSVSLVPSMISAPQTSAAAVLNYESTLPPLGAEDMETRKKALLIVLLVGNELERIAVWNNPLNRLSLSGMLCGEHAKLRDLRMTWEDYVDTAWAYSPELAVMLWIRHPAAPQESLQRAVTKRILHEPSLVANCPLALRLLVTEEHVKKDIPQLKHLLYWAPTDPPSALAMLRKQFQAHPLVTQYALRVLRQFTPDTLTFYLPQLVQSLRYDKSGLVEEYLVEAAGKSELLAHQIIWNAQTYPKMQYFQQLQQPLNKAAAAALAAIDAVFSEKVGRVKSRIINNFTEQQKERFEDEFQFFDQFTQISSKLLPVEPDQRKARLREELKKAVPKRGNLSYSSSSIYLPFAPHIAVRGIETESGVCLRSAEKVPIMVHFHVNDRDLNPPSPSPSPQQQQQQQQQTQTHLHSVIFKSGDDTRQDMLAVQVIELLMRIFESAGLSLYLFPYKIIATKPDCGMIEVVPNSLSRDQLGQKTDGTMYDYFIGKYGARNSQGFQNARNNFIRSMAAYSVASYLLQVKDRHNGNILIDEFGHLVHIDFGFLFDRSPGGDIGFERSPFKITDEMIEIMGGSPTADQFIWFMEQGVKAFLSSREFMPAMSTIVELMLDTQLPCFKPTTMENLTARFFPNFSVSSAAKSMSNLMTYAFSSIGTFFTYFYDKFQQFDNGITM